MWKCEMTKRHICVCNYFACNFVEPDTWRVTRSVLKQQSCWLNMEPAFTLKTRRRKPLYRWPRGAWAMYFVELWKDDAFPT